MMSSTRLLVYNISMRKKKPYLLHLLIGAICLSVFFYILMNIDPTRSAKVEGLLIPSYVPFYLALFLGISFLGSFFFQNIRRGALLSGGIIFVLILRMMGFKDLLYTIIPMTIVILVEFLFWKKR